MPSSTLLLKVTRNHWKLLSNKIRSILLESEHLQKYENELEEMRLMLVKIGVYCIVSDKSLKVYSKVTGTICLQFGSCFVCVSLPVEEKTLQELSG